MQRENYISFFTGLSVAAVVGIVLLRAYSKVDAYFKRANRWCSAEDGTLVDNQASGETNWLQCKVQNAGDGSTYYDMNRVADLGWTHNTSQLQAAEYVPEATSPWYSVIPDLLVSVGVIFGLVMVAVALVKLRK